jgi:hypothetical protein
MKNKEEVGEIHLEEEQHVLPEHALQLISFTNNGLVSLYNTNTTKNIDTFDLKRFIEFEEVIVTENPIQEPIKEPIKEIPAEELPVEIPKETPEKNLEYYKNFIKTPITIEKGDSAWKIQKSLTPTRNIAIMLELVKEVNGNKTLHPIYPGEERIFLSEPDITKPTVETLKDEELKAEEPIIEEHKVEVTPEEPVIGIINKEVKLSNDTVFKYSKSEETNTLYAYNDISKSFYSITSENGKLKANVLFTNSSIQGLIDFKIIEGDIYYLFNNGNSVNKVTLSNPYSLKTINLEGITDCWTVKDNVLYYSFNDNLSKIDLTNDEKTNILIGDKTLDMFFVNDTLFVLNTFGSKENNSILLKIDTADLNVDKILELNNSDNFILSVENKSVAYLGQIEKTTELNKNITKNKVVASVDLNLMELKQSFKNIDFNKTVSGTTGYIYVLNDSNVNIHNTKGNIEKSFSVEGNNIMPLKVAGENKLLLKLN